MNRPLAIALALAAFAAAGEIVPYFSGDVQEFLDNACRSNKRVVVSLGRERCGRCQKFYRLLADGSLALDGGKCLYLKMNVDEMEHHEYFSSWFDPPDPRLPFVGVLDPNACTGTCITAACGLDSLRGLLGDLAKPPSAAKAASGGSPAP